MDEEEFAYENRSNQEQLDQEYRDNDFMETLSIQSNEECMRNHFWNEICNAKEFLEHHGFLVIDKREIS